MEQTTHRIKVQDTGGEFDCREDEFILEAMRRNGSGPIHYGCYGGGCGVCKMKVVSGAYRIEKKMSRAHVTEQELEDGIILICCAKPCSDITLTTPGQSTTADSAVAVAAAR